MEILFVISYVAFKRVFITNEPFTHMRNLAMFSGTFSLSRPLTEHRSYKIYAVVIEASGSTYLKKL